MEIKKEIQDAINKQINREMHSSYLYLSMAAHFDAHNLSGFSHWMKMQAKEEWEHAMKFYKFVFERGGKVVLETLEKPKVEWSSPFEVFKDAYEHEQLITRHIDEIVFLTREHKDNATESMLKWFVDEQVEEEDQARSIMEQLAMVGDNKNAIMMLNHALSKRK